MSLNIKQTFGINLKTVSEGKWYEYGDGRFLIASSRSKKYEDELMDEIQNNQAVLNGSDKAASRKKSAELMAGLVAKHILLGWENIELEAGKPLKYSVAAAKKLLMDEQLAEFYLWVRERSDDVANYRFREEKEVEKN